jgi:hypothetical protein
MVEGIGGPCPHCHTEYLDFDIEVENDQITGIVPVVPERRRESPEGYRVLEE